ncbi:alpha/beta fold hydrolase [Brevibacillus reuszeri]|uniref:alpha/beta fold hydrolase n=1 Tax=Brevibacillus reuszeri TaxID=54915 RepID=UPI00289CAD2D|nr:alpha/beta hydrolase [Brevibacillus reuszeri]
MAMFTSNGISIYYETEGEGFPLIGIQGKDSNLDWWHPSTRSALADKYRFIMLDNRGSGRSGHPAKVYGVADMATDVVGLMNELQIEKAYVLGQSMGGMIAQEVALQSPDRVEKLVLVCTTPGVTRAALSSQMLELINGKFVLSSPQDSLRLLFPELFIRDNPELMEQLVKLMQRYPVEPRTTSIHDAAYQSFDSYDRLPAISVPTMIIHGEADWIFTPAHAEILAQRIPDAQLLMVPDAGHGVFLQEHERIIERLARFLSA